MENTPSTMKIHKVYSNSPMIFDDNEFGLSVLVTFDDEDISEARETVLHFDLEEDAEQVMRVITSQFVPLEISVMLVNGAEAS